MSYHTLYLCYFGLRESLVQTQVLPYLREIKKNGVNVSLLTFEVSPKETWTDEQIEKERNKLKNEGIDWHFLTYHKRPSVPATLFDIFCGVRFILIHKENIDILHGRSHVATAMGAIAKKLSRRNPKLIFDIRGFFPEEYVDAGNWKRDGAIFKSVKKVEKWLLKKSDGFVVLTERAREILFPISKETGFDKLGRPLEVIPCCVDLRRFENFTETDRESIRKKMDLQDRQVVVYVGSFGGWYMTEEILSFYKVAKEKNQSTFALILTQSPSEPIKQSLRDNSYSEDDFYVDRVSHTELPKLLVAADFAISFIKPCYSKLSSSPTKLAEYLACGLPVITNSGIGDVDEVIETDKVGVVIDNISEEVFKNAIEQIEDMIKTDDSLSDRCKKSAKNRFDLILEGGTKYRRLYRRILG